MTRADPVLFFMCLNDRAGAEISMIKLAEGLRAAGRNITLAVYGRRPELGLELGFKGEIINLDRKRTWSSILPLYLLTRRRKFPTVVSALTHTNIAALLACSNARVVITEHSIDGVEIYNATPLFALLTRTMYRRAAVLVGVSQVLAKHWRALLPAKIPVTSLYNPVVEEGETIAPPPAHPWLTDKEIPVVIGIGRLKDEKNFPLLMRAFAQVIEKRQARLIILGEGPERDKLQAEAQELGIADKTLLPGFSPNPPEWLAHARLLVCSSIREGFGNVIAEALAWGVPVVACDCPCGPAEILQNGRYGRLVPRYDAAAMARAIIATLDEVPDQEKLRSRASDFTVARCIDAYGALIDNLTVTPQA